MKLEMWKEKYCHKNSKAWAINVWARGLFIQLGLTRLTIPFFWKKQSTAVLFMLVIAVCVAGCEPETKYIIPNVYEWQPATKLILLDNGVDHEDIHDCLVWAFGENYDRLPLNELDDKWRELHSDSFEIAGYDCIIESTKKIGVAYLAKGEQE
jgi:hypothetical protein